MTPLRGSVLAAYIVVCLVWGSTYLAIRIGVRQLPPALFGAPGDAPGQPGQQVDEAVGIGQAAERPEHERHCQFGDTVAVGARCVHHLDILLPGDAVELAGRAPTPGRT